MERVDMAMVQQAAHTVKGSVGNFRAADAFEAAKALELSASEGGRGATQQAFDTLLIKLQDVRRELLLLVKHLSLTH